MSEEQKDPRIPKAAELIQAIFNEAPDPAQSPHDMTALQVISVYLLAKSMRTLTSINALWKIGMAEDIAPLTRSIYESYIVLLYLKNKGTELEAQQFSAKAAVKAREIAEATIALYPDSEVARRMREELPQFRADEAEVKQKYLKNLRQYDRWDLLRKHIPFLQRQQRALTVREMAKKIGQGKVYKLLYAHLSSYLHADAFGASNHVQLRDDVWEVIADEPNQSHANGFMAIAISYVGEIFQAYNEIHNAGIPESKFKKLFDTLKE